MEILFEKTYPKNLVDALMLVHQTDAAKSFSLFYYDKSVDDSKLFAPVVLLFDYNKRGLSATTENLYQLGFRIFAMKTRPEEKLDFYKLSLTILGLWPKILETINEKKSPFVFTYKYCGSRLVRVKE
jgi:hypothetical protein